MRVRDNGLFAALVAACVVAVGCVGDVPPPIGTSREADTGGCALPALTCSGVCRDLMSDTANCGVCGRACAGSQVCSRGACASGCGAGLSTCSSDHSCHDLQSDPYHCGACDRVCSSGQSCSRGRCVAVCDNALTSCGRGSCVDLMTDPSDCGACGRQCLAGEVCTSGACALPSVCSLGTASNTTAVVDQSQTLSATTTAATLGGATNATVGQSFTAGRVGFLSGVEVSLTTCGGALTSGSTIQLTVRDDLGQTLGTATVAPNAVTNGPCPRFPPSLSATARGAALFDLGPLCIPVSAGQRLSFMLTATGATTSGACPSGAAGTRRCNNAPTVACTANANCVGRPAIVSVGFNPLSTYAGGSEIIGSTTVAGASLAFKTHVTPYVLNCGGTTSCSGVCRDLTIDRNHCGACGRGCTTAQVCSAGTCAAVCGAGLTTCMRGAIASCANLRSDNLSCGACGNVCAPGQVCAAGACVTTCGAGMSTCGRGVTAYCARTATDNANCGTCGNTCPAGRVCSGGVCATICGGSTSQCGATCVDTRYDPANCGSCDHACPSGLVCVGGACTLSCGAGVATCGSGTSSYCTDAQTDNANCGRCGARCGPGQVCSGGACGLTCSLGTTSCGSYCARTISDNANCGGCGINCGAGTTCTAGRCDMVCGPGQTACAGTCVDLAHDTSNCGSCGRACAAGQVCTSGACAAVCGVSDTLCGGACVATRHDPDHCGSCGAVCPPGGPHTLRACAEDRCRSDDGDGGLDSGRSCGRSVCGTICSPGYGDCDGDPADGCERDLSDDSAHCGACGHACALPHGTSSCRMGACVVAACAAGYVDCNGDPTDGCELREGADCALPNACVRGHLECSVGGPSCLVDETLPVGTICRPAVGACDVAETCDGSYYLCPSDAVAATTVTCRAATGPCDVEERCDGATTTCPSDVRRVDRDPCDDGNPCTTGDICQMGACVGGAGATCTESECGGTRCDPATGACIPKPDGTLCDDLDAATRSDTCFRGACLGSPTSAVTEIAASDAHVMLRTADGVVYTFGDNARRELGDGTATPRPVPARLPGLHNVAHVAAAPGWSLAVTADGAVAFWGELRFSDGTVLGSPTPASVVGLPPDVVGVAAGRVHGLAVTASGEVWAWGENSYGQLGGGALTGRPAAPRRVPDLEGAVAVAASGHHSVALTRDGAVWAWGDNGSGEVGVDSPAVINGAVRVAGLPVIAAVAAGGGHDVALASDGTVWAWGRNDAGQLGDGTLIGRSTPQRAGSIAGVVSVSAGGFHTLATGDRGELWGWGSGSRGQLGTVGDVSTPTRVAHVPTVAGATAGAYFSLARATHGELLAFGEGDRGQLGDDSFASAQRIRPNTVVGFGRYETLVLTQANDPRRTGANLHETNLTVDNVTGSSFGRIAEVPVQGRIVAQPLYVSGVSTSGGVYDVLYVATAENWLYAFDVASLRVGTTPRTIWPPKGPDYFGPPFSIERINTMPGTYYGIVSTPVIDLAAGTIYVVAKTDTTSAGSTLSGAAFRLHAFDLTTGAARPGSPTLIEARVPGNARIVFTPDAFPSDPMRYIDPRLTTGNTGYARDGRRIMGAAEEVVFEAYLQFQRPGLLLQDGRIYLGFGGIDDRIPYHGWILAYDARTLRQDGAYVTTPNGDRGVCADEIAWWLDRASGGTTCAGTRTPGFTAGIAYGQGGGVWQASNGLAGTGTGDLYFATGNSFDEAPAPRAFSNAVLRVGWDGAGALTTRSYFQPADTDLRDEFDQDLGSAGPLLLPGTNQLFVGGKRGRAYVLDRTTLGGFTPGAGCAFDPDVVRTGTFSTSPTPSGWPGCDSGALGGLQITRGTTTPDIAHGAVYWNGPGEGRVYVAPGGSDVRVLNFSPTGALITVEHAPEDFAIAPVESQLAISANGDAARSGVLWQLGTSCAGSGAFVAYDAANVAAGPIWSSGQDATPFHWENSRFSGVTVADGRAFIAGWQVGGHPSGASNLLLVYGPLSRAAPPSPAAACAALPPGCIYTGASQPTTWSYVYTTYFAPGTAGHCQSCHTGSVAGGGFGTTQRELYDALLARGLIAPGMPPSASSILDPGSSRLRWVGNGGNMPLDGTMTPCQPASLAAVEAIRGWLAAGGGS